MSRNTWRTVLGAATLVCLMSFSPANADNSAAPNINQDPCLKCHKRNGTMQGVHGNEQLQLSCSNCHGEKGIHPRKPNDIMVFTTDITLPPLEANQRCWQCHDATTLGEQAWFHNMHANKLYCWSCHQLHPQDDPALQPPSSQVCRRCHAEQSQALQEVDHG
ncbi:hypothetical protein HR45_09375 [Shewanella mangrovi]|uniref:Cytochrome c-type protein NrfB-like domain-containing protein n=1 Tax=Shewanella mangrovi TaxID=1515746 RepID=A0A094JHW1_9GAMM|nr:cytochrome c3 family protein [Shewanella mangrovi]KFZ37624.1 hypothetical protein HR45_09375 [Shewanella mangrovi]